MHDKTSLAKLTEAVHALAAGDYRNRIQIDEAGELSALAAEVNKLAEAHQMAHETIRALNHQLKRTNFDAIMALTEALSAKDPYTRGHSERVSMYSLLLSESLGLKDEEIDGIHVGACLHDVGKIGIPEAILNKQGKLSADEYKQIMEHANISGQIVSQIPNLSHIAQMVRYHHERYDGNGYPDGLRADNIPLGSRILSIADAFDAMTSARPYSPIYEPKEALIELKSCCGTQFDPVLCEAFVDTYAQNFGEYLPYASAS